MKNWHILSENTDAVHWSQKENQSVLKVQSTEIRIFLGSNSLVLGGIHKLHWQDFIFFWPPIQSYIYQVLQTIQMKLILVSVWAEPAVLGSTKTALKFKFEI